MTTDLAKMWSLSSFSGSVKYLLCVADVFTKHTWVKPLKAQTVLHGLIETVNKSKHKPNKIYVDKGKEFYDSFMQK